MDDNRDKWHDRTEEEREDEKGRKGGAATITGQAITGTTEQAVTASGLNLVAGVWLIIAPFILGYGGTVAALNDLILGIVIGVIALIRIFSPARTTWLSWVNAVAGLWLIFAPSILGYVLAAPRVNDIVVGIIVVALSAWSALSRRD